MFHAFTFFDVFCFFSSFLVPESFKPSHDYDINIQKWYFNVVNCESKMVIETFFPLPVAGVWWHGSIPGHSVGSILCTGENTAAR